MEGTSWTNFPTVQNFQKVYFYVSFECFLMKQYCIIIYFFKEMSEVEGQRSS